MSSAPDEGLSSSVRPTGRSELGLALAVQLGAFVLATLAITPFVRSNGELKPGISGVLVGLAAAWPVLAVGVVVAARRRGVSWPCFVGAMSVRFADLGMLFVGIALQFGVGFVYYLAGTDDRKVSAPARELTDRTGGLGLMFAVLAVFVVIGAPIFEELFYRGLVLNAFRRAFGADGSNGRGGSGVDRVASLAGVTPGIVASVAMSSLWFGLIHFQLLQLLALVFVGIACAVARLKTGRIFTSICLHAGFNLATMVALGLQLANK